MRWILLSVSASALASSCFGAVVGTTGAAQIVSPPVSLMPGAFANNQIAYAMNEKTGVLWNGMVDRYLPPIGPTYTLLNLAPTNPGPKWVNSHIIHFDTQGTSPSSAIVTGTVTFDQAILGVICTRQRLDASDAALGNSGTIYPFGHVNRGFSLAVDSFRLLSPNTLQFWLGNTSAMDQIRVLTVPTPGTLAGFAGLVLMARRRR